MENQISELFKISTTSLKDIVDVDTMIGKTIVIEPDTYIIPVSKVKCTFATGGTEQGKARTDGSLPFGGATGGSVTITPVAFLVSNHQNVSLLHLEEGTHIYEKLIDLIPNAVGMVKDLVSPKPKVSTVEVIDRKEA